MTHIQRRHAAVCAAIHDAIKEFEGDDLTVREVCIEHIDASSIDERRTVIDVQVCYAFKKQGGE
jgi:hypothetical protein